MKRGKVLFGVLALVIFSWAFIAGVQAWTASGMDCSAILRTYPNRRSTFCTPGTPNYNPAYCQCYGGSSGDGGNVPSEPLWTEDDAINDLEEGLCDAYETCEDEQNYCWDCLDDTHKEFAEHWFEDDAAFYENHARQDGDTEFLQRIEELKARVGEEGMPPVVRAEELSVPIVGGRGTYGWEISTHGYPNLEWISQLPEFPKLTLWHGEDGKVHYDNGDDQDWPFEGFGVRQGEEIVMPKMATYNSFNKPGVTASANNLVWGEVTFVTVKEYLYEYEGQTMHPTVKVNEDADVGMKKFSITVRDKNGNIIDTIPMVADIQPKNGGGLIDYTDESMKSFSKGIGHFFIYFIIFIVIVIAGVIIKDRIKVKTKEESAKLSKKTIGAIVTLIGVIMILTGLYFAIFKGGATHTGIWLLVILIGFVMAIIGNVIVPNPKSDKDNLSKKV